MDYNSLSVRVINEIRRKREEIPEIATGRGRGKGLKGLRIEPRAKNTVDGRVIAAVKQSSRRSRDKTKTHLLYDENMIDLFTNMN